MLFSCIPLFFAQQNIVTYAVGVLMSYFGLTAFHVLNQNLAYRIDATARSRINAVYMTFYFRVQHLGWMDDVASILLFTLRILLINRYYFSHQRAI